MKSELLDSYLSSFLFVSFLFFGLFCFVLFFPQDRVFLCSPGCPGTHSVDQAGLKLRNPPASVSQVLGLKACTINSLLPSFCLFVFDELLHYLYNVLPSCIPAGQKRAPDPITYRCEIACGC